jgi:hypothetical protein
MRVALGFRVHSGWATCVVAEAFARPPGSLLRARIELADDLAARQPYHAAAGLPLASAAALLERLRAEAGRRAERALAEVIAGARRRGDDVVGCGLLLGSGRSGVALEKILASHALIHTSDGDHFRDALRSVCEKGGLMVTGILERELIARASLALRASDPELQQRLKDAGRALGPPWRRDEKYATLAAWTLLADTPGR